MAKLYFRYGAMGCGKSIDLLKAAFNYEERGQEVLLYTTSIDDRFDIGKITTRIGLQRDAIPFSKDTSLYEDVKKYKNISCVFVDESQFLTEKQVYELSEVVDKLEIPVICYGLRTDFKMKLFEGSRVLFELADKIEELKTICECGQKATENLRYIDGKPVVSGKQLFIGGNEAYKAVCRKCYKKYTNNIK